MSHVGLHRHAGKVNPSCIRHAGAQEDQHVRLARVGHLGHLAGLEKPPRGSLLELAVSSGSPLEKPPRQPPRGSLLEAAAFSTQQPSRGSQFRFY